MPKLRAAKSSKHQSAPDFEFLALENVKEESIEIEEIKQEGEDGDAFCKLCCESDKLLKYSVYDDVIVSFFNAIPNLVSLTLQGLRGFKIIFCFSHFWIPMRQLAFARSASERRRLASTLFRRFRSHRSVLARAPILVTGLKQHSKKLCTK